MGVIKDIIYHQEMDRYEIRIEGERPFWVRGRTFNGLGIKTGDQISRAELEEREKYVFKLVYARLWGKEKERLKAVSEFIKSIDPQIRIEVTGFGAQTDKFIEAHPEEQGKPDLTVYLNRYHNLALILVEVTGSDRMQDPPTYWIRPDKIEYMRNHREIDIWFALYYKQNSHMVFIKPDMDKDYPLHPHVLHNGIKEYYVEFRSSDPEVHSGQKFAAVLREKIAVIRRDAIPFSTDYPEIPADELHNKPQGRSNERTDISHTGYRRRSGRG